MATRSHKLPQDDFLSWLIKNQFITTQWLIQYSQYTLPSSWTSCRNWSLTKESYFCVWILWRDWKNLCQQRQDWSRPISILVAGIHHISFSSSSRGFIWRSEVQIFLQDWVNKCCVFQPANMCSAHRSLVEINFLMLKQLFAISLRSRPAFGWQPAFKSNT